MQIAEEEKKKKRKRNRVARLIMHVGNSYYKLLPSTFLEKRKWVTRGLDSLPFVTLTRNTYIDY